VPQEADSQDLSFEDALTQLEQTVHELEEGELALNEALDRYEKGVRLLRQCHAMLQKAERRIELLSGVDVNGNPLTSPVGDEALTLDEKARQRSGRRSAPGKRASWSDQTDVDSSGDPV
jgi:exodeoxyribonuclease VII small subunit